MTDKLAPYRCLAIVNLSDASTLERLAQDCPPIIDLFRRFSNGEMEQAFRSNDGTLFGYFLKTNKPLAMIRSEFERHGATSNADKILLTELGAGVDGNGFSRASTWLQRH